jgi:hypothetical protein
MQHKAVKEYCYVIVITLVLISLIAGKGTFFAVTLATMALINGKYTTKDAF